MDAAATVSSLMDKMKALLDNKEVITPERLKRKIRSYIKDLNDGHELLTKQITPTDGLDSKLLRCAYEVEDIIDSFVLRAGLQRQRMLTKMRSVIPILVSTWCQNRLSDELKEPMECLKKLLLKDDQDTGRSHGTAEPSASEEHQARANEESTSHGQDADSAGPSISDEQKISSTTEQSNSDEQPVSTARTSIADEQVDPAKPSFPGEQVSHSNGAGPTNSNEHAVSDDQRVFEGQPAHAVDSNNLETKANAPDGQSTQTPGPSTVSGKKQAQTVAPQQWANISNRLDEELEFVGLNDQVELIEATLKRQKLRFLISVVGAAGSGKTTIVRTIYNKKEIVQSFQYRAWVHVSKEFSEKDLLIDMLKQATTIKDEEKLPLEKLQERVRDVLISRRCLIVLDDVQTSDVQNLLKNTFINSLNGSRVILTVRDRKIIDAIDAEGKFSLELRRLTSPESLELFSKRVRTDNRSEIPKMEQIIDKKCQGLPLAIVVLAGLLSTKEPSNWSKVIERINFSDDPSKAVLTLAYQDLPPHLKPCLLYLGLFPKERVIPIRRLFRLWEAEGLVKCSNQGSPEEVSPEKYFEDLVKRNMIEVARWRLDGSPITSRAPGILHDNVFPDAADSGFFSVHPTTPTPTPTPSSDVSTPFLRRAAVYTDISKFQDEDLKHLRSYISFNNRKGDTPADEVNKLLQKIIDMDGFALITVLDLEHVYKPVLSDQVIGKLLFLKYLGLRWTFLDSIPKSVGDLPRLETLDVKHTNITCLPKSIWNSKKLQHLYMNNIHLDVPIRKQLPHESPANLVTLRGLLIGRKRPSKDWLNGLKGLRTLALTCHIESLQEIIVPWISESLTNLRSLKLRSINEFSRPSSLPLQIMSDNQSLSELYLTGSLPPEIGVTQLPQTLKMLSLAVSKLEHDPMPDLGKLPNLNILRLFARSYLGKEMTCQSKGFPALRVLKLWMLEELEKWTVPEDSMPLLRELEIRCCENLRETDGWQRLSSSLKELILTNMPPTLVKDINKREEWDKVRITVNTWDFDPLPLDTAKA
ncbi:hypothetical protein OIU78_011930 [Salix suchowensis]|nr:hypothetical protein OIU78_011930 [Salix suchowensis]